MSVCKEKGFPGLVVVVHGVSRIDDGSRKEKGGGGTYLQRASFGVEKTQALVPVMLFLWNKEHGLLFDLGLVGCPVR